jgi:hypothetical protein
MKNFARSLMAAALLTAASSASAVVLTAGVASALPGTTVAIQPHLAGVVLEDETQAFSFAAYGGTISGTVQSRVVRSTVDGTLDFYWRVESDAASSGLIQSFRIGNFFASIYDADWRIDGVGETAPTTAYLFPGGNGEVNYNFGATAGGFAPGSSTYFMMMDTDAKYYAKTALYDLANIGHTEISDLFATFAPGEVPEPASAALFGLGFAGLALARRRKSKG